MRALTTGTFCMSMPFALGSLTHLNSLYTRGCTSGGAHAGLRRWAASPYRCTCIVIHYELVSHYSLQLHSLRAHTLEICPCRNGERSRGTSETKAPSMG